MITQNLTMEAQFKFITPSVEDLSAPVLSGFSCGYPDCDNVFKTESNLNMHVAMSHKQQVGINYGTKISLKDDLSPSDVELRYLCPVKRCKYTIGSRWLPSLTSMKQHYRNVHMEKPFKCKDCPSTYLTETLLQKHQVMCNKVFSCKQCSTPYAKLEALLLHQKRNDKCRLILAGLPKDQRYVITSVENTGPEEVRRKNEGSSSKVCTPATQAAGWEVTLISSQKLSENSTGPAIVANSPQKLFSSNKVNHQDHRMKRELVKLRRLKPKRHVSIGVQTSTPGLSHAGNISTQTDVLHDVLTNCNFDLAEPTNTLFPTQSIEALGVSTQTPPQVFHQLATTPMESQEFGTQTFTARPILVPSWSQTHVPLTFTNSSQYNPNDFQILEEMRSILPAASTAERSWNGVQYSQANTGLSYSTLRDNSQATQVAPSISNTDFGTQTNITSFLEQLNSSSIQLQCNLAPYEAPTPDLEYSGPLDYHNFTPCARPAVNSSFGTQTSQRHDHGTITSTVPYSTNAMVSGPPTTFSMATGALYNQVGLAMTSTTTPTSSNDQSSSSVTNVIESMSDFAMQFPHDLNNFGTQTILNDFGSLFDEDEDILGERSGSRSVFLSASSTQTDLDFLFNHNHTQTDFSG